jgi:dephospho-CoA kinase
MLEIALTGNRFTGKNFVASKFKSLGVPVFNADTVLRFIINHRFYFEDKLKNDLGKSIFIGGKANSDLIKNDKEFDILIDNIEKELFEAYDRYRRYQTYPYTIFLSSILFERKWNEKFDYIINTFAPDDDRAFRGKVEKDMSYTEFFQLKKTEMSQFEKNSISTTVIHSYNGGTLVEESVIKTDYLIKEKIKKLLSYAYYRG